MRLGVDAALVDDVLVPGDVDVDRSLDGSGSVRAIGLAPAGSGRIACAGFIDLQVNGFAGHDLLEATASETLEVAAAIARTGVTAWQPTLVTAPPEVTARAIGEIAAARDAQSVTGAGVPSGRGPTAQILGVHLEGPFLSSRRLGAHRPEHRLDPTPAQVEAICGHPLVRYVTLAPELPGALDAVRWLVDRGVVVSVGHTDATAAEATAAFDAGARTVTHLGNAMRPFTPRDPGVIGAALTDARVVLQVILDGHHLADETVRLVFAVGAQRLVLVTDAVAAAGLADGEHRFAGGSVTVTDGAVRLPDGTLAGSALTMDGAVRAAVAAGLPLTAALIAVTARPAALIDASAHGRLRPGARADVVVLDDRLDVQQVLIGGEEVA